MDLDVRESIKRGSDALKDAERLLDISLPAAAGRLYIAGENLAYGLVKQVYGSSSRNHGTIWKAVHELFVRGLLKKDYRTALEASYRLRIKGDYGRETGGEEVEFGKVAIAKQIKALKDFDGEIKRIIDKP